MSALKPSSIFHNECATKVWMKKYSIDYFVSTAMKVRLGSSNMNTLSLLWCFNSETQRIIITDQLNPIASNRLGILVEKSW